MTPEEKLRKLTGPTGGMSVPENYFPEAMQHISASLPEHPMLSAEAEKPVSRWVKIRPILYMAAMFAGIWLTMKVLTSINTTPTVSIENPPALVAAALKNPENVAQMVSGSEENEMDMAEDIIDSYGGNFGLFVEEFNKTE